MGKMLLINFIESEHFRKNELFVSSRSKEKLQEVEDKATVCDSNAEVAASSDIVFICLRPMDIKNVLEEIRASLKPKTLLVSLNGSVSFTLLGNALSPEGEGRKIAKVIPSVTAEINRSQTLVCYNEYVEEKDKEALKELLCLIGNVIELPENEIGMGSELVSCMPGFIASIFDCVCAAAKEHTSIPKEDVVRMVLQTMIATGELMIQDDMTFEEVVTRVATPGGITEEGTKVVYAQFPKTAQELFEKTLEKRKATFQKAEEAMK